MPTTGTRDGKSHELAQGYWSESWRRIREDTPGVIGAGVLLAMIVIALTAPLLSEHITHFTLSQQDLDNRLRPPLSGGHILGTDELGRDTLTRLVFGAQVSLLVGFLTVALVLFVGGGIGLIAGYFGGIVDGLFMRLVDMLLALPTIYILILIASLLPLAVGPAGSPWFIMRQDALSLSVILALTGWGPLARLVRAEALAIRHREFVTAARSIGASHARVILHHVLPNVLPVMIVAAALGIGFVILAEAALDFIGLGIQPPTPSWGNMLRNAQTYFYQSPALIVLPGAAIVLTVIAANVLGNAIRDSVDPRLR